MRFRAFAAASGLLFAASGAGCFVYNEDLLSTGGAGGTTATTTTSSMGGTTTTTTTTGMPCSAPAECPASDSPCKEPACEMGTCGFTNLAPNTKLPDPTPGDCHAVVCDSAGGQIPVEDSADVLDDGKSCTVDTCELGAPKNTPKTGFACNENGGKHCNDKGDCVECAADGDCASQVCKDYKCAPASCNDGAKNGSESDTDCGGACQKCPTGGVCKVNTDCKSGICTNLICAPSCTDEAKNQNETDVDCGGSCPPCADLLGCLGDADCQSLVCKNAKCAAPACNDGKKNGSETAIDCGGAMCPSCPLDHLVINEVDYDQPVTDNAEFVEIYNGTANTISLAGLKLIMVDGSSNVPYGFVDLAPGGSLAPGQYLVVVDDPMLVNPAAGAVVLNFANKTNQLQNGSPDGLALIDDTANKLIDVVSYEGAITTADLSTWGLGVVSLVEGVAINAGVKDEPNGSLCRFPNGKDTGSSASDWLICSVLTPGAANQQ